MDYARLIFALLLGRRLPITSGELSLPGLRRPVRVDHDQWGIPSITAENDSDAWLALGFCQGQDRAFQLEGMLRVVRGTLAELVGPDGLPVDRLSRRLGMLRSAREQVAALDPDVRANMAAFAAGVSAGSAIGCRKPAHEFRLLGSSPTPWTVDDAVGILKLQSLALGNNWDSELTRLKILTEDGPAALAALDPAYPEWQGVCSPPGAKAGPSAERLAADLASLQSVVGSGGSNNWAVNAARTRDGHPLLANDPHLAPTLPPHWYLARLATPEWTVVGASFAGAPVFPAGHNGFAAWGVTVGCVDNTDLFIEQIGPDGRSVRRGDGWERCEVLTEEIEVKGSEPVVEEVLITPRGPIIGPALAGDPGAISIRAVWLDAVPLRGLLDVHRSRSFEQFRKCWEQWPALSLNMIYADAGDTIGWQLTGASPVRRKGSGAIPQAGWDTDAGWEDELVPFADMPVMQNPKLELIVTANAKPTVSEEPFLGVDWIEGFRQDRAVDVLAGRRDWDIAGFRELQADVLSIPWREMRDVVLGVPATDPDAARALDALREWDGRVTADSGAASIFEVFLAEMYRRTSQARAPRSWEWALGKGYSQVTPHNLFHHRRAGHLIGLLRQQPPGWFTRPWPDEVADALATAYRRLAAKHGPDPARWSWGTVRPLTLLHPVGARKPLDRIFNLGPFPRGGDQNTVAQCGADPLAPEANPPVIQSMRMIVDLGHFENSRWVLPGGQSGNPVSPHYADQLPLWKLGEGVPIPFSDAEVKAASRRRLSLSPSPG
jgi:penicillin G amidase